MENRSLILLFVVVLKPLIKLDLITIYKTAMSTSIAINFMPHKYRA